VLVLFVNFRLRDARLGGVDRDPEDEVAAGTLGSGS